MTFISEIRYKIGMDWKIIIAGISDAGLTQKQIAERVQCGQSTISELARGEIGNPSYSIGKGLLELHASIRPTELADKDAA